MPRLRKTTTSSRTWLLLATGLIGVAPATAIAWMRLANDDAPAATAAAPGSIDTSSPPPIELPPALPEPEAARPSIDSPVVSTGVALEPTPPAAPPPPLPAPAQEAAPKPSPKPTGGFVDGPILARPIDEPIPAASGRSAAGTSDPPPPPTPALPRGTSEPPTQAPGDTPALLPLERGGPGFAPPVPTPLDRPATDTAPREEERGKRIAIAGKGPITIRLVEESIRKALDLLAQQAGVNILPSTQVAGTVTLNLENVTFEEALDALTRVGNLGVRREGTLIYVYTSQELKTLDAERKTPVVRVYCLNYVRANDLAAMIRPFLSQEGSISVTPANQSGIGSGTAAGTVAASRDAGAAALGGGGGGGEGTGMSGGGVTSGGTSAAGSTISTGSETGGNSLAGGDSMIVRDHAENIAHIDEIVRRIDIQPLQVLIEAVIISVELNDTQQLGMNFSLVDKLQNVAAVGGNGNLINAAAGFTPAKVLTTTAAAAPSLFPRPGQLVNGFLSPDQGLKFGFISQDVSGFIRAIESLNKVNVLASPRVLVLNKQRAEIQLGQRLGYRNTVTNLVSSLQTVQFLSVGTLLSLRPFVSQDGMVRMEIHPEKSTGALDKDGIPQTITSELTTNILVPDGATIVIGGLIDSSDQNSEQGVLGLSRLPVVGPLFRERTTRAVKTELIVLLTPRIVNRAGLPEPQPGLPPVGPMGIPNSGPMPGPAVFAERFSTPFEPVVAPEPPPVPSPSPASIFEPTGPITGAKLRDYEWIGASAEFPKDAGPVDPGIERAGFNAPAEPRPVAKPSRPGWKIAWPWKKPDRTPASPAPKAVVEASTPPVPPIPVSVAPDRNRIAPGGAVLIPSAENEPAIRDFPIDVSPAPREHVHHHIPRVETPSESGQSKREGYRPGDLIRGVLARRQSRRAEPFASSSVVPSAHPAPPPPATSPSGELLASATPPVPSPTLPLAVAPQAAGSRGHSEVAHIQTEYFVPRNASRAPESRSPESIARAGKPPIDPQVAMRSHVHATPQPHSPAPIEGREGDQPMPHQVLSNPVGSTGVTYRWHTVQPGETFASLAKAHYGSASLRAALWRVNRHLVSEPDDLLPGTMILIPPAEVLDRLVESSTMQAIEQDDDRGGRISAPVQSTSRRLRLFQRP